MIKISPDLTPRRDEVDLRNVDVESGHITSIAEAVGQIYKGKVVQVYWSEAGGTTNYADYLVHQNMFIEGVVLWGKGDVFAMECEYIYNNQKRKKQVLVNAWSATMIALKDDGPNIDVIFKGKGYKL